MDHIELYYIENSREHCQQLINNAPKGKNYYSLKDGEYWPKHCVGNKNDICLTSLQMLLDEKITYQWHKPDRPPRENSRILLNILGHTQSYVYEYRNGKYMRHDDITDSYKVLDYDMLKHVRAYYYIPLSSSDKY